MNRKSRWIGFASAAVLFLTAAWSAMSQSSTVQLWQERYKLIGWNDLGMHCVDGVDYSVFSILPPYNNIHAHLIDRTGKLVRSASGVRVTYQAIANPATGLINRTSVGKTNFWQYVQKLFGVSLPVDQGLTGLRMPGSANSPQSTKFDTAKYEFVAEGVPITPYPDNPQTPGQKDYYPLLRLTARDSSGKVLATADVVVPVSDEMACAGCHASATITAGAMPPKTPLAFNSDPGKDYKLNILALHDDRHGTTLLKSQPVLCAGCHASNVLGAPSVPPAAPLTAALHSSHAKVYDPAAGRSLGDSSNRAACYKCHPGSETKCLRGAMGNAGMECQNCHGGMAMVGASTRRGWLDEPSCENCHTGTAMKNSGQIRYINALASSSGPLRQPADRRFAALPGTLYRLSKGHGNLNCEVCHGSTHAEYPADGHAPDNLQIQRLQGYSGVIAECGACHKEISDTGLTGGPHGLHIIGAKWVDKHGDAVEKSGTVACKDCHGADLRGAVLSAALTARSFSTKWGPKPFAKGAPIGCWSCHNGPDPD